MTPDEFLQQFQKAAELLAAGRHEEAQQILQPIAAIAPQFVEVANNLGVSHYQRFCTLGDKNALNQAKAMFEYAVQIKPDFADALSNLGNALDDLGDYEHAEQILRRAVAADPSHADACSNLGMVLHRQNKLKEAIDAYKQAIRATPSHAGAWCNLGEAFRELGLLEEAVKATRKAVELQPNHPQAAPNLIRLERILNTAKK